MNILEFQNALKMLRTIERKDFERAGIMLSHTQWYLFNSNPEVFFLHGSDAEVQILWDMMMARYAKSIRV